MSTQQVIQILETIGSVKEWRQQQRTAGKTVGFVPTMGYLHEGHAALIEQAKTHYDTVIVSVFVNPTQFGPNEDYEAYPRDLESDRRVAAEAGATLLFSPSREEMYPENGGIRILPGPLAERLCGALRPGHFDGVLQVVLKLANIVQPDGIFFGKKDAQQLALIETFFRDFNVPCVIHRVPTVREADGLAKSSRNVNLTDSERAEAPAIFAALQQGEALFRKGAAPAAVEQTITELLSEKTSGKVDYVSLLSYPQLAKPAGDDPEVILACAVKFSKARLIDNIIMKREG